MGKVSIVINTLNEEKNIERAIASVKWADEIVVCDMYSEDKTVEIAKKNGAKLVSHRRTGYVEPARNFAIGKTGGEWILILDADEEIPQTLAKRLKEIVSKMHHIDFVEVPRKNIIFGKWMKASMWWPDYNIRFFKKGKVKWTDEIHRPPKTAGTGLKLEDAEEFAIVHHHYSSISQFVERLSKYTEIQSKELASSGYKFSWSDLITKPIGEFLGRYFANKGFEDGLHGLALSLLQAFSFLVMYLRVWEMEKFPSKDIDLKEIKEIRSKVGYEIDYWFKYGNLSKNPFKRFIQRLQSKVS